MNARGCLLSVGTSRWRDKRKDNRGECYYKLGHLQETCGLSLSESDGTVPKNCVMFKWNNVSRAKGLWFIMKV